MAMSCGNVVGVIIVEATAVVVTQSPYGQSKVGYFDVNKATVEQKQIGWLNVPVQIASIVHIAETVEHLVHHFRAEGFLEESLWFSMELELTLPIKSLCLIYLQIQSTGQISTRDQFEHIVHNRPVANRFDHIDNVRMTVRVANLRYDGELLLH